MPDSERARGWEVCDLASRGVVASRERQRAQGRGGAQASGCRV